MINEQTSDSLEIIIDEAHIICDQILLFETLTMEEDTIRHLLTYHHVSDLETQRKYLDLVERYNQATGGWI